MSGHLLPFSCSVLANVVTSRDANYTLTHMIHSQVTCLFGSDGSPMAFAEVRSELVEGESVQCCAWTIAVAYRGCVVLQ